MSVEMVHVYRGEEIESIHRGDIVAVDKCGSIVFSYGDPYKRTYWRSAAKPFQVIKFVESGGIEKYGLKSNELALMTSSHGGEEKHVETLESILSKICKSVSDLDCGVSRPMNEKRYKEMLMSGEPFSAATNPCSGKHSGMIGLGVIKGIPLENYIDKEHPIQQIMIDTICDVANIDKKDLGIAIDGCGVPVFALPIYNMALAFSKLSKPHDMTNPRDEALSKIGNGMVSEPFYVAGTRRLDTVIMEETKGRILAKLGAESVYCMTVMDKGIGIALKTEDGGYRALDSIAPVLLYKHGYIDKDEYRAIESRLPLEIKNHRGQVVGRLVSAL